jgi:hypothetical protein
MKTKEFINLSYKLVASFIAVSAFLLFFQIQNLNAAAPQLSVYNQSRTPDTASYVESVAADTSETLRWQIFHNDAAATSLSVDISDDQTYVSSSESVSAGNAVTVSISGSTVTFTFASSALQIIRFETTVVDSATMSTTHSKSIPLYLDGSGSSSDTVNLYIGPIITSVSPTSGSDLEATPFTVYGHGFTQVSEINSIVIGDGIATTTINIGSITVSGPVGGIYSISGTGFDIPKGRSALANDVILNTTVTYSSTDYNFTATSTDAYTVVEVTSPILQSPNTYTHSTGKLSLTFNETIDVSKTDATKIELSNHATAGDSITLTGATVSTTDNTTVEFTLAQDDINTVSSWSSVGTLYVRVLGYGIYDLDSEVLVVQTSRTGLNTWTKDTTPPEITSSTYSVTQNSSTSGNLLAGTAVFSVTMNEPINVAPKIAINQQGSTDISATEMTLSSGTTYTYTYTVQDSTGGTYIDGTATSTISIAADYASNVLTSVDNTFTIDTTKPTVQSFEIAQNANTSGTVKAGATTITVVMSEAVSTIPKITINQLGTSDISETDMTSAGGNTYTYSYTVNMADGSANIDGSVTAAISAAVDTFGNTMITDSSNTFTVNTTTPFVTDFTVTQNSNTSGNVKAGASIISVTMSEAVTIIPKIAINQPGSTDISATDMTSAGGNVYTYSYTVQSPDASTYIDGTADVTISAATTSIGGTMSDSSHTFVIDNVKPTISSVAVVAGSNSSGNVKEGTATITVTMNESLSIVPKIAIDQQGSTDISATDMTLSSGNTYTYSYTVNTANGGTYVDGTATITITTSADLAENVMDSNATNTFNIDTVAPNVIISDLTASLTEATSIDLSFTSSYVGSDFGTFKSYYSTSSGVSSSNGTMVTGGASPIQVSGISAGTTYYFVVYICDSADNCSSVSNEAEARTQDNAVINSPSSGGGGGSTPSSPGVTSSAKSVGADGGKLSTTLSSGSSASVDVAQGTFDSTTTVSVSETTSQQLATAPLVESTGEFIGNNIFNIEATSSGQSITQFDTPVTLEFTYTQSQLAQADIENLRIAYFNEELNEWIPLSSTVNPTTGTVTALVDHFTLFALISFTDLSKEETVEGDTGQILGSSVGVYPNGSLLKAPSSSAIWYIAGDEKHLIKSAHIFESKFNWDDIIDLPSSLQLDLYATGADVKFATGTLVKEQGNSSVYRVSVNGGVQPILSEEIFNERGYDFKNMIELEEGSLALYPEQSYIQDSERLYSGDLVKIADNSAVYFVDADRARLIPSASIFKENAYKSYAIREIKEEQFDSLSEGLDVIYQDGTLVKGDSSAIYVISNARKMPILSGADFEALLYNWNKVVYVPDVILASINNAPALQVIQKNVNIAVEQP